MHGQGKGRGRGRGISSVYGCFCTDIGFFIHLVGSLVRSGEVLLFSPCFTSFFCIFYGDVMHQKRNNDRLRKAGHFEMGFGVGVAWTLSSWEFWLSDCLP